MLIRFGEHVRLTNGEAPTLLGFHDTAGAFVEYDHLIEREVKEKDGTTTPIGPGYRAWVKAPGFRLARDRDGAQVGMIFEPAA